MIGSSLKTRTRSLKIYVNQQMGSLEGTFKRDVAKFSKLIGDPKQYLEVSLLGDLHPSHIVIWGSIEFGQLSDNDVRSYLAGILRKGYLVDYSLSLPYSAAHSFPIFSMTGENGLILHYRVDNDGTQRLAIRVVAPNAFLAQENDEAASEPRNEEAAENGHRDIELAQEPPSTVPELAGSLLRHPMR